MPAGRPSKLNKTHHLDERGRPVTVADTILTLIRRGEFIETSCAVAGINKVTLHGWLQVSRDARDKAAKRLPLTRHELDCLEFSNAIALAEAESEILVGDRIMAAGMEPARTVTTVTKKVPVKGPDGDVSWEEQTEVREVIAPPNLTALIWRAEHRFQSRWGRHAVEVTGADGGPIEVSLAERKQGVLEGLREFMAGAAHGTEVARAAEEVAEP